MSLWPGHLHPSISERNGEIRACSLVPNPLPSWFIRSGSFRSIANILDWVACVVFLSDVEWGVGESFCASPMVTRLIRDGLSVDKQATHVDCSTGQSLLSSSVIRLQLPSE